MLTGKIWGSTKVLLKTPIVEVHHLIVLPNAHCSLHAHNFKHNCFFQISGKLTIEIHKNDYDLVDKITLNPGDITNVRPGEYHRFVSGDELAVALEIYYLEPLSEDIIRKDHGGILG